MKAHYAGDYERKAAGLAMRVEFFIQTRGTDEGRSVSYRTRLYDERREAVQLREPYKASETELARDCSVPRGGE